MIADTGCPPPIPIPPDRNARRSGLRTLDDYGANGKLIAREASWRGLKPVIAGRNPAAIEALAAERGLEERIFDLDDADALLKQLEGHTLVLNCAGPFKARIGRTVKGPDEAQRQGMPTFAWGEATNARGNRRTARIRIVNSYHLTVDGSLVVINYVTRTPTASGTYTPSKLLGMVLVTQLAGLGPLEMWAVCIRVTPSAWNALARVGAV